MLADRFLKKRYEAGYAKGLAEARAEGRADLQKDWEAWNERRQDAEARGQTFDEPPPALEKRE